MGKYLRSCTPSSPAAVVVDAASYSYLTLRSGRRVPAAGGGPCGRLHRRGGGGRRCGKNGASARECGVKSASASAPRQQRRCKMVGCSQGGERAELSPSEEGNSVVVVSGDICGERRDKPISGEVLEHDGEHNRVTGRPSLSPTDAEIEAFFAAAELAERRRFAETYNYDVALDCPLQGRFEWEAASA
ncbi:hypothetical protein E2562_004932 [Oryza meyeriana var. granulata]|uniref:Cyclin-dependent kinase inhibitor domain-containing protein n=1 Tax=Oryza meyeriana var. granulata TaxID=110450 RepID=A0A6G1C543_9ORYZ|nr:hypothetical protein E2562_004932 [Oryza meyeriana var. granulata]